VESHLLQRLYGWACQIRFRFTQRQTGYGAKRRKYPIYGGDYDRVAEFRSKFALPEEKIVLYVGRLVYEKGIHVLINAVPKILSKVNAKFIIVGSGYMKEQLLNIVRSMGLEHKVLFEGFMDEATLLRLQTSRRRRRLCLRYLNPSES
jgi:glycosyltransferase involved in cell wall biosynthesis